MYIFSRKKEKHDYSHSHIFDRFLWNLKSRKRPKEFFHIWENFASAKQRGKAEQKLSTILANFLFFRFSPLATTTVTSELCF